MPTPIPRAIDPPAVDSGRRRMFSPAVEREVARLLGVTCDVTRVKIVRALRATPLAASDLAQVIGRTRSATSQHLRVLREVGVVAPERKGNVIRYHMNGSAAAAVLAALSDALDQIAA